MKVQKLKAGITRLAIIGIACLVLTAAGPSRAAEQPPPDTWQFNLLLYGWLPSIDGTLQYGDPAAGSGSEVDASTIIDDIQMIFMGGFEARKSKWAFMGDVVYLDMADDKNNSMNLGLGIGSGVTIDVGAQTELTGWLTHLAGAYNITTAPRGTLDFLFGTRYLALDTDIDLKITGPLPPTLPTKNLSRSVDVLDGVIGVRGQVPLIGDLYLPYHLDVGAGSSQFSWQAIAGLGYRFSWGGLLLDYRHISFNMGEDELIDTFSLSGPVLGVMFSF